MIKGRFFTAANMVSVLRIPLTLAACFCIRSGNTAGTIVFMVLAILSDTVDGKLARATGTVSDWGKILDPVADKIAFLILAVTLLLEGLIPLWMLVVLAVRDLLIVVGGSIFYRTKRPPSANIWGKLSTLLLSIFMLRQAVVPQFQIPEFHWIAGTDVLGLFSILLVVVSFATYVYRCFRSEEQNDAT